MLLSQIYIIWIDCSISNEKKHDLLIIFYKEIKLQNWFHVFKSEIEQERVFNPFQEK